MASATQRTALRTHAFWKRRRPAGPIRDRGRTRGRSEGGRNRLSRRVRAHRHPRRLPGRGASLRGRGTACGADGVRRSATTSTDDALVERLAPFEVVVAMRERTPFPRALLERLPRPAAARHDRDARTPRSTSTRRASAASSSAARPASPRPTAELTWALILAVAAPRPAEDARGARRRLAAHARPRARRAGRSAWSGSAGSARRVAAVGQAFGMEVIAWSQNLTAERARPRRGAEAVAKDELFARADVVTVHLVLSDRTRGLVGAPRARGDEADRATWSTPRAGRSSTRPRCSRRSSDGTIAGAALDVFDTEPLPAGPSAAAARRTRVLTPHIGYVSDGDLRDLLRRRRRGHRGVPAPARRCAC